MVLGDFELGICADVHSKNALTDGVPERHAEIKPMYFNSDDGGTGSTSMDLNVHAQSFLLMLSRERLSCWAPCCLS